MSQKDQSLEAVYQRLNFSLAVLFCAGLLTFLSFRAWRMSAGFLIGGAIGAFNFIVLKRTVSALGQVLAEGKATPSARRQMFKFLLRYLLLATALYVIFKSTSISVYGLFLGLFLPAAAVLIEAVYELYLGLIPGSNR